MQRNEDRRPRELYRKGMRLSGAGHMKRNESMKVKRCEEYEGRKLGLASGIVRSVVMKR